MRSILPVHIAFTALSVVSAAPTLDGQTLGPAPIAAPAPAPAPAPACGTAPAPAPAPVPAAPAAPATGPAAPAPAVPGASSCATGVHIIASRASVEAPGPGIIGKVAMDVMAQIPGSDLVALDYPATLDDYIGSQTAGVTKLTALVGEYAAACPNSKMVLMGYSQGAQVTLDALCGASESMFPTTQALQPEVLNKISSVIAMGDPSRVADAPFNQGTAKNNGVFPRQNSAACGTLTPRIVSFCNANDTFCDSGSDLVVHLSYVQSDGETATKFVVNQFRMQGAAPVA